LILDVGTSRTKGRIFNSGGVQLAAAEIANKPMISRDGFLEFDSDRWWKDCCSITRLLLKSVKSKSIEAVGVTGQMTSPVWLDHMGKPLGYAISFLDRRVDDFLPLAAKQAPDMDYSASKLFPMLLWMRKAKPERVKKIRSVLDVKEFIGYQLTGEISHEPEWETPREVLGLSDAFEVPTGWFGKMHPEVGVLGHVSVSAAKTRLKPGTPVMIGPGDGICSIVGLGLLEPGIAADIAGTNEVIATVSNQKDGVFAVRHCVPGLWINYKQRDALGLAYSWFATLIGKSYSELDAIAKKSALSAELGFIPNTRTEGGIFYGIRQGHRLGNLARAVLEGICFEVRGLLDQHDLEGPAIREVRLGGGASNSRFWTQLRANVSGRKFLFPKVAEATSLGMAVITNVALREYDDFEAATHEMVSFVDTLEPDVSQREAYSSAYAIYRRMCSRLLGQQTKNG
jgi:xylulokinase